jgi:hypothetical protein
MKTPALMIYYFVFWMEPDNPEVKAAGHRRYPVLDAKLDPQNFLTAKSKKASFLFLLRTFGSIRLSGKSSFAAQCNHPPKLRVKFSR